MEVPAASKQPKNFYENLDIPYRGLVVFGKIFSIVSNVGLVRIQAHSSNL